ncbi:MAG: peptidase S8 [Candidatus Eremiobacteraeota bacterium]|nr:peptidase S8 [Candidatus Eremiobacteraeota bacterium]
MRQTLALLFAGALLAGCSASGPSSTQALPTASTAHSLSPQGDSPGALPGGDGAEALPGGNSPGAFSGGDSPGALPGSNVLACLHTVPQGSAACSVALNVNAGVINDPQLPQSLVPGYHPSDLQTAYGLTGAGATTVAIVDAYDDPSAEADLAIYRTTFGLGTCSSSNGCFRKVDEHGGTAYPAFNMGWSEEIAIDVEMVSAICPHCSILLVEANSPSFDDLVAAVDTAVAQGARIISNSYYAPEWSGETAYDTHYNHPGVAMTVSSGDEKYASYPAVSPYVTSVGGTILSKNSAGQFAQIPWSYTGHGCSAHEPRPSWQSGLTSCPTRAGVDVTAVADPQSGVSMFDAVAGGWLVAGGTSVGAPIIAGAYALAGNGATTPYVYAHRSSLRAIGRTFGIYTGLGSPNGIGAF